MVRVIWSIWFIWLLSSAWWVCRSVNKTDQIDQKTRQAAQPAFYLYACLRAQGMASLPFLLPLLMSNSFPSLDSCILPIRAWLWEVIVGFGIVVLGYIGLLYFGATIVPGVGISGHLIGLVPWRLFDWAHAPGYGILAMLLTCGLQRRAWPLAYALPVAAAAALVFGLWTEVFQGSVQGRQTTADDLVTDAIGIGIATIMMLSQTVRNRIALRDSGLDSFLSFWRAGFLVALVRRTK